MANIDQLKKLTSQQLQRSDVPLAFAVDKNVAQYDCASLTTALEQGDARDALKAELASILLSGGGAFVLKGAFSDTSVVDEATGVFKSIIAEEKLVANGGADHFAASGANDRIWNSLEKLAMADANAFVRYHANPWIALASDAWLGPAYQVTAQVNLVRPGGKAQEAHCDYHLGFMRQDQLETYPPHVHAMSHQLTLQGAVAHCDMPIESGTTKLLPFSQNWSQNYTMFRDPDVRAWFDENHVQLPLEKGDLLFFSPGLLHGAGDNTTSDVERMANLLQVSSAFGIALETIGRTNISKQIFQSLKSLPLSDIERRSAIASAGHGYPFPTNLDTDPPVGGLAPPSQQDLLTQAVAEDWSQEKFDAELDAREAKRPS